ncbi:methyltransferase-like protein 25 isoform X1 [Colossoma macropomum]|uniref:methyltransferase-like protein 25 isoform X1 n=1 Tax=Colossoma macropomum TaxID=42526 RepID=UPI0018643A46|nr:methyltransferase-like protein 25 isoform X1 [Colossoma macropomum]
MAFSSVSADDLKRKIDEVQRFLSVSLSIANAHTVDFYTRDVWQSFVAVSPEEVLTALNSARDHTGAAEDKLKLNENISFGFCDATKKLVDVEALLRAAKTHSLPGLGVCVQREAVMDTLRVMSADAQDGISDGALFPDEFMNSKKAHEVPAMSEVVASLAKCCRVKQVIDVGSGKGYLCSFLTLQYDLQVFGIDCSSVNTHGAQERNRKLKKFSRAYQRHSKVKSNQEVSPEDTSSRDEEEERANQWHRAPTEHEGTAVEDSEKERSTEQVENHASTDVESHMAEVQYGASAEPAVNVLSITNGRRDCALDSADADSEETFFTALSPDIMEQATRRVPPSQLSLEERERRKRDNLERKARNGRGNTDNSNLFSPLTSYVTAETELRTLISELEDAVMVGLHTCGDLAPSTLRMFVAKPELQAVCSVGCCYHLLSEQFDQGGQDCETAVFGFPMSQYLREQACFCGRNARMSACLALERVSVGGGLPMESLFYRAVLHVILRDHYDAHKSEKRVGNVYSKASSFVDYVRRALRKLDLDESKLSDSVIQSYHDLYSPRMSEMVAFNMLKVTLAPCIEGLILLDRLCYLKEQENVSCSALVQLFDPLLSPRCYAVVGIKRCGIS